MLIYSEILLPASGGFLKFYFGAFVMVASFTWIKIGYQGFEMKWNPVFWIRLLYSEK